jgi:signal transduction histidine kinase
VKRSFHIWLLFSICAGLLLSVTVWASIIVIRLERENTQALRKAELEESIRLAMWRLDSAAAPIIARETARPYFEYSSYYPAERAYTRMFENVAKGEILIPSPLLLETPEFIDIYFQFDPDGNLTSPQFSTGLGKKQLTRNSEKKPVPQHEPSNDIKIPVAVKKEDLIGLLPEIDKNKRQQEFSQEFLISQIDNQQPAQQGKVLNSIQNARNMMEQQARAQTVQEMSSQNAFPSIPSSDIREGVMEGVWIRSALVLARRVRINNREYIQGCTVKWEELKIMLKNRIQGILPEAELVSITRGQSGETGKIMASLPVKLIPGQPLLDPKLSSFQAIIPLFLAWACVLIAVTAVGFLLYGVHSLSERRAAFVSAVTHELRTPLTTFRMYAEMLAEGMVTAPEKRKQYLDDLCSESDRLSHLVENVLSYARLEKNRKGLNRTDIPVTDLINQIEKVLRKRTEQEGFELSCTVGDEESTLEVRADIRAVEQILFNLVDNACKYAVVAENPRIDIETDHNNEYILVRVRDNGPGITQAVRSKLFTPFSKSAQEAAVTKPGVGLGLALSRRLARQMEGDLDLDRSAETGACFVLSIPRKKDSHRDTEK